MVVSPLIIHTWTLLLAMSKRKIAKEPSSKHLSLYKKSYKGGGTKDRHFAIFQHVLRITRATKVLYPGCHRHLTAALIFSDVTFVDYDSKVEPLYSDPVAKEYVQANKVYDQDSNYQFYCYNVNNKMPKIEKNYDLLISLSAGAIAEPCANFIRPDDGYLLVNDAHSDARTAFVSDMWNLVAYWDDDTNQFTSENLDRCFQVIQKSKETKSITKEQVQESIEVGTVRKRSFKLLFEPMFFLFQKK